MLVLDGRKSSEDTTLAWHSLGGVFSLSLGISISLVLHSVFSDLFFLLHLFGSVLLFFFSSHSKKRISFLFLPFTVNISLSRERWGREECKNNLPLL